MTHSGVHDEIGDLYHAGYRRLVAQVYAFTTDLGEAQDAVQEAFARALARPHGLAGVDAPEAWLRTVAVNVVRRRWRRKQILNTLLLRERPLVRVVEPPPEPDRADLRDALAALPRPYREVIVLHYLADLPVDEVAAILEVPVGTVKSRLSRGREALKGLLDDVEAPPLNEVRERARKIRTRRRVAQGSTALALVCASLIGFFLFQPPPQIPVAPKPTPSVAPSYFADGIVINGIFDPVTAPDLPGTITHVDMLTDEEGWLSTPDTEAHTTDGGQTWVQEPRLTPQTATVQVSDPLTWTHPRSAVATGFDHGVPTVYFGAKGELRFPLEGAGDVDGITAAIRPLAPLTVIAMTMKGGKVTGVYEGGMAGLNRVSGGGGMSVSGEPILLPDGRLLVADKQNQWQLSSDLGVTWHQTETGLPTVGSLHATQTGYVALDLFRFGWVALSKDGLTWQKLPIR